MVPTGAASTGRCADQAEAAFTEAAAVDTAVVDMEAVATGNRWTAAALSRTQRRSGNGWQRTLPAVSFLFRSFLFRD